jgi:hypothetical protein
MSCLVLFAGAVCAQSGPDDSDDGVPTDRKVIEYIRTQIEASQARLDHARGSRAKLAPYEGLPDAVSARLPENEGFVRVPRVKDALPLEDLVDVSGLDKRGLTIEDVVEDEEWARLPDGTSIRRDRSRGYEIWHYPTGTRLVHRIFLKPNHQLLELRMQKKLDEEPNGADGPWAFGIYRPVDQSGDLQLYKHMPKKGQKEESLILPLPSGLGTFLWTRMSMNECRSCHISMGEGWYQYSDEDHAGPCGFTPKNHPLRGLFSFIGP